MGFVGFCFLCVGGWFFVFWVFFNHKATQRFVKPDSLKMKREESNAKFNTYMSWYSSR